MRINREDLGKLLESMDLKELRQLRDKIDDVIPVKIAEYAEVIKDLENRYVMTKKDVEDVAHNVEKLISAKKPKLTVVEGNTNLPKTNVTPLAPEEMQTASDDTAKKPHFRPSRTSAPIDDQLLSIRLNVKV